MKQRQWSYTALSIILLIVSLIAVNVVGSFLPLRLDVTDENLYTISEGTEKILDELEETVTLKFYYTKDIAALPPNFKTYAQRVEEVLEEYENLAGGKIKLEVFDPQLDTEEEEWAQKYGLSQVGLSTGESFFLGMVTLYLDQEVAIPFFDIRREQFLEYDISQVILRVSTSQAPKIGVLTVADITGLAARQQGQQGGEWVILLELKKNFEVELLPVETEEIPDDITLLLLMHPQELSDRTHYAVDQYVLRGGRLVVMVDPNFVHQARTMQRQRFGPPPNLKSELPRLLTTWGVIFHGDKLVGDPRYATPINSGRGGIIRYPFWMSLTSRAMDGEHPITSELETLLFVDSGHLSKIEGSAVEFYPLIETSSESGTMETMKMQFTPPEQILRELKPDQQAKALAAFLRDRFKSVFPEGQPPLQPQTGEAEPQEDREPLKHPHLTEAKKVNTILVIADVDFASDSFSVERLNFLGQVMINPLNDNLNFILNTVEFLSGNDALMSVRTRGRFSRPFTRVIAMENEAQQQFQEEETVLQNRLREVQTKLNELEEQKNPQQKRILTAEQQEAIKKFRSDEIEMRKRLREIRKILRQDIETLENWLIGLNMLLIPVLVAVIGIVSYRMRAGKRKQ